MMTSSLFTNLLLFGVPGVVLFIFFHDRLFSFLRHHGMSLALPHGWRAPLLRHPLSRAFLERFASRRQRALLAASVLLPLLIGPAWNALRSGDASPPEAKETPTLSIGTVTLPPLPSPQASLSAEGRETALDAAKERYEDIFISYLYLQRCGRAEREDYILIYNHMLKNLEGLGQGAPLADGVVSAAWGSYEAVYSEIPCKDNYLTPTAASYDPLIASLRAP